MLLKHLVQVLFIAVTSATIDKAFIVELAPLPNLQPRSTSQSTPNLRVSDSMKHSQS